MSDRITQKDVAELADQFKTARQNAGQKTWLQVRYYNGWCHLEEVSADNEARHTTIRHVFGGTKREVYQYLQAAIYGVSRRSGL